MRWSTLTFWISFCILLLITNCRKRDESPAVSIIEKDSKSVGISIKGTSIRESDIQSRLKVRLARQGDASMLGEFKSYGNEIIFEPLVAFTPGFQYQILLDDSVLAEISIPSGHPVQPELISIYPTHDTVPENLLKIYLQFSQPMVEGRSADYVTLTSAGDTMSGTFLDLQPELWNVESTVLTLWLDPGRIKRDLIPNKELGAPLTAGKQYVLHISETWPGKNGATLSQPYEKKFVVMSRDEKPPDIQHWRIAVPDAGTAGPLEVNTPEPIDYILFKDALRILTSAGDVVEGTVQILNNEKIYRFLPEKPWSQGKYILKVESRLEDLAGNNLNRPFDRNVESTSEESDQKFRTKEFEIH